jgi:hypothetical protein
MASCLFIATFLRLVIDILVGARESRTSARLISESSLQKKRWQLSLFAVNGRTRTAFLSLCVTALRIRLEWTHARFSLANQSGAARQSRKFH